LGRLIKTDSTQRDRTRLSKMIVLALRELMKQKEPDLTSRDLAAFVSIALLSIYDSIEGSVTAWEKRGYWVKADRFRRDWEWSKTMADEMTKAVLLDDWGGVAIASVKIAQKLNKVTLPLKHRLGTPWIGAYEQLKKI